MSTEHAPPARTLAVVAASAQSYAAGITAEWQPVLNAAPNLVTAILATGRRLLEVKGDLPHGQWLRIFRHGAACKDGCSHVKQPVPFSVNMAQKLMRISVNPLLSNAEHVPHLPPDTATLRTLASLPKPILTKALADGTVHPAMRREDVRALKPPRAAPAERAWTIADALADVWGAISVVDGIWPHAESRTPLVNELRRYADMIEKKEARRVRRA